MVTRDCSARQGRGQTGRWKPGLGGQGRSTKAPRRHGGSGGAPGTGSTSSRAPSLRFRLVAGRERDPGLRLVRWRLVDKQLAEVYLAQRRDEIRTPSSAPSLSSRWCTAGLLSWVLPR